MIESIIADYIMKEKLSYKKLPSNMNSSIHDDIIATVLTQLDEQRKYIILINMNYDLNIQKINNGKGV